VIDDRFARASGSAAAAGDHGRRQSIHDGHLHGQPSSRARFTPRADLVLRTPLRPATITEPDPDGGGAAAPATTLGYASHRLTTVTRARRTAAGGSDTLTWSVGYTNGKATSVVDPIAHASYADVASTFTYDADTTVVGLLKTYNPAVRTTTTYARHLGRDLTSTRGARRSSRDDPASTLQSVDRPSMRPRGSSPPTP
jgi:hypothetical protein